MGAHATHLGGPLVFFVFLHHGAHEAPEAHGPMGPMEFPPLCPSCKNSTKLHKMDLAKLYQPHLDFGIWDFPYRIEIIPQDSTP